MAHRKTLFRRIARSTVVILGIVLVVLVLFVTGAWLYMIRMPGDSFAGDLPPLTRAEQDLQEQLRRDVAALAGDIGVRCLSRYENLLAAEKYIEKSLAGAGYEVHRQEYAVEGKACANLVAELAGRERADEIIVVGAHYDTVASTPGADDNASAVAGLLALARAMAGKRFPRTLRLVAFVNEEPPHFQTERMGSLVYARSCQARKDGIVGMLALEMLGTYTSDDNSQHYPPPLSWFYPSRGNFIAFVGDTSSRALVHEVVQSFRKHARFPSEGAALIAALPGVGFSDHWSFWQIGVPAVMVTDTAFFRNPRYHEGSDSPDRLDYDGMARVVAGLEVALEDLLSPGE